MFTANNASAFDLKKPSHYFSNTKTLALLNAALSHNLEKAMQLVNQGADPNDDDSENHPYSRLRLLHYAIAANNKLAVKILIGIGADPELDTEGTGPAFLWSLELNNIEMFDFLLDLKSVETLKKETIITLLFESTERIKLDFLELLLDRDVSIDTQDSAGMTILIEALDGQDFDLAKWILLRGASVHIDTPSGTTPSNTVQYFLNKFKDGTPSHNKVLELKQMMEDRGIVFPVLDPKQIRENRK